jgi:ABC-type multidrug transport system ATPase subunit
MLLDEPFAGIDPIAVHDIQEIVAELKTREIGVIISDHNVEQTLEIVDRAYIMYRGSDPDRGHRLGTRVERRGCRDLPRADPDHPDARSASRRPRAWPRLEIGP